MILTKGCFSLGNRRRQLDLAFGRSIERQFRAGLGELIAQLAR
jgi:hypothetical protein